MKRVVVFGVFDLLHPGHLYFLREAKKHGTHLTVVLTRDVRVRAEKKHQPFFNERERLSMVGALKWVDRAILGDKVGEWTMLKRLHPDVVCVGYDQEKEWIMRCGLAHMPRVIHIMPWYATKYRSSMLLTGHCERSEAISRSPRSSTSR